MKIKISLFLFNFLVFSVYSQITYNASYSAGSSTVSGSVLCYLTKFGSLGYKRVVDDHPSRTLKIYNTNNSLYNSIAIPSVIPNNYNVYYLSDNLFNLTNDIEYLLVVPGTTSTMVKTYIFNDVGNQIFSKDSADIKAYNSLMDYRIPQIIYYDGSSVKMQLWKYSSQFISSPSGWDIYTLPGSLPCIQCSATGTTIGRPEYQGNNSSEPLFYPNPANDQIKLKYDLPKNYKSAEIRVQDMQGKLLETYKVTNDFDFIYVPSNYNNGLYLYSLVVDGAVIKTEKIILSKN
ncbi:MAG: T9SS type A sorting domain-containing protein [Bacteroidota bacterium]